MTEQNKIQEELRSLKAGLPFPPPEPGYRVPAGYFENLPEKILNHIKCLPSDNARDELAELSPLLSGLSREMPYSIPKGYFQDLTVGEEKEESLSPLLTSLKSHNVYVVPKGYFEELPSVILRKINTADTPARVIPLARRNWVRMAAAAVITGIIATLVFFSGSSSNPDISPIAKKVSTEEINSLLELVKVDSVSGLVQSNSLEDVKKLVKDIPEKEIQDLLNDATIDEMASDDGLYLN